MVCYYLIIVNVKQMYAIATQQLNERRAQKRVEEREGDTKNYIP